MEPQDPNWDLGGELLLAVSGVWPSRPLAPKDALAARALPKAWIEEIRKLLEGAAQTKTPSSPQVRFLATWKRLNAEEDDAGDALTVLVSNPQIAAAYKSARKRAIEYLKDPFRPVMVDDLQQTRLLEPSVGQQLLANEVFATVNDPGRVVYSLRANLVAADSLALVQEVYPAIDGLVRRIIDQELHRQRARRAGYRVPWSAELVLRAYLGEPIGSTAPAPDDKAGEEPADATGPAPEAPPIDIQRDKEQAETPTDRVSDLGP